MKNKLFLSILGICFYFSSQAQHQEEMLLAKKRFPDAKVIQLNHSSIMRISLGKQGPKIEDEILEQHYIIDPRGYTSEKKIAFVQNQYQVNSIDAQTFVYQNNQKQTFKVKKFEETSRIDNSIFYDDVKFKRFFYEAVQSESVTDLKYTGTILNPYFIVPFYFTRYNIPLLKSTFKLMVDKNIDISYMLFADTTGIQFNKTDRGKEIEYTWTLENRDERPNYDGILGYRYIDPHVLIRINKYSQNGQIKKVLSNIEDLYQHEYKYIEKINQDPIYPELANIADSISKMYKSNEEIAQQIFYWVKDHIKYIAFEDGEGGLAPRNANDIYHKRYGDCKDYSSLTKVMLNHVGIEAYLAWVGSDALPYTYSILSPLVSNHMIVALPLKDGFLYLDGTSTNTPYNLPSGFIQGKECLIAISKDSFQVRTVPLIPAEKNKLEIQHNIEIRDNGTILSKDVLLSHGLIKSRFLDRINGFDMNKRDESIKEYLSSGNNKCKIIEYKTFNDKHRDSVLKFVYTFEIADYVKMIEDDYYVNLNLNRTITNYKIDTTKNRKVDYHFNNCIDVYESYDLKIPPNFKSKKIPDNLVIETPDLKFLSTYTLANNKVLHTVQYVIKNKSIQKENFNIWNKNIEQINNHYKQLIVLEKIK